MLESGGNVPLTPNNPPLTVPPADPTGHPTPAQESAGPILFPDSIVVPCSTQTCTAGHSWQPQIAIAKCPGCASQILAVRMMQCPACNEPAAKLALRVDHLPTGGVITPLCRGSASLAENLQVVLEYGHAQQEQDRYQPKEVISKI